jgi:phage baseplate assembly protein V
MKLRNGTIVEMKPESGRARVRFAEDGIVSAFLPIVYQKTTGDKFMHSLDPGQYVACMMDEHSENGVIVGAIYAGDNAPVGAGADIWAVTFSDGTRIEYDRENSKLTIDTSGDVLVKCDTAEIDGDLKVTGDIDVDGGLSARGEVTAMATTLNVSLSTHMHPTAAPGPPSPPTPGT